MYEGYEKILQIRITSALWEIVPNRYRSSQGGQKKTESNYNKLLKALVRDMIDLTIPCQFLHFPICLPIAIMLLTGRVWGKRLHRGVTLPYFGWQCPSDLAHECSSEGGPHERFLRNQPLGRSAFENIASTESAQIQSIC